MNIDQAWATANMSRSRTFTRELNDPKAQDELVVEDIETNDRKIQTSCSSNRTRQVKKFKLNTFQIEADDDTRNLMSRTESLLQSKMRHANNMAKPEIIVKKSVRWSKLEYKVLKIRNFSAVPISCKF